MAKSSKWIFKKDFENNLYMILMDSDNNEIGKLKYPILRDWEDKEYIYFYEIGTGMKPIYLNEIEIAP